MPYGCCGIDWYRGKRRSPLTLQESFAMETTTTTTAKDEPTTVESERVTAILSDHYVQTWGAE